MTMKISNVKQQRIDRVKADLGLLGERLASILTWDELDQIERKVLTQAFNDVERARARILGDGL